MSGVSVRQCLGVFYANDGMVGSRDLDWMQHLMNVLVCLFQRYGLVVNVAKLHTMTCQPDILRSGTSEEAKAMKCTGVVDSYQVIIRISIPLLECVFDLTKGLMTAHRRRVHGTEPAIDWSLLTVIQTEHQPEVYNVIFPRLTKQ